MAALMLFLLFPGHQFIEVKRGESLAGWGPTAHASLGMLVLILSLVRIVWRLANPPPALHVLATLKHHFIDRDGLVRRMMFR